MNAAASQNTLPYRPLTRPEMARLVASDIPEGWYVNLGIGIPTLVADNLPPDREVILHSENGMLGMGPAPDEASANPWLVNAGKSLVTLVSGGSYFEHADSFAIIRGGHLDLCVLGAYEVAENGDLANWATLDDISKAPAVGGAMDLANGAKRIWVLMEHETRDGQPRLRRRCTYPLTAAGCVRRVYTNLAVLDVTEHGFAVRSMIDGLSREELQARTDAALSFADAGASA
jgi:3-oxoadipate CoA-transferase beta subunit